MKNPKADLEQLHAFYQSFQSQHPNVHRDFREAIEDVLSDVGLTFDRVSVRLKSWPSLRTKARKRNKDGSLVYPDPIHDIHDLLGVRVTTLHSTEIPNIIDAFHERFKVLRSVDKAEQTRISGDFGYGSHHLLLQIDQGVPELSDYEGFIFEVQIRTVLQHAWAEFEHDIRYKRHSGALDPRVDRAFTLAAGLIELADAQFDLIADIEQPSGNSPSDIELSAEKLPGILALFLSTKVPQSRLEDYQFLEELLSAHGINTVGELKALVDTVGVDHLAKKLGYRFTPGHVRVVDDLLLRHFGLEHIEKTSHLGNRPNLRQRKLRQRFKGLSD